MEGVEERERIWGGLESDIVEKREVGLEKRVKRGVRREREERDDEREVEVAVVVAIGEARKKLGGDEGEREN